MTAQMAFPDTWEEFEKHYGFYDSKQAYTYGNTRLIASFRVQQWLDHIDDIKHKKQSQKNKMEQIAAMFGKKLNEPFEIRYLGDNHSIVLKEDGAHQLNDYLIDFDLLHVLLTGQAEIVEG